jgi:hypothetical protein
MQLSLIEKYYVKISTSNQWHPSSTLYRRVIEGPMKGSIHVGGGAARCLILAVTRLPASRPRVSTLHQLSFIQLPRINIRMASTETPDTTHPNFRLVMAPKAYEKTGPTVFLSGSIDTPPATWQHTITAALSHLDITLLNPHREDWDASWREDPSFKPWAEQVKWELDGMEAADVVAVYFGPRTPAPITLLELGLWARSGKCIVGCSEAYPKKGNVRVVCERYGIECVGSVVELGDGVKRKLEGLKAK